MPGDGASVGEVHVDVTARALGFWASFEAQTRGGADKVGNDLGAAMGRAIQDRIGKGVSDGIERGSRDATAKAARSGTEIGDALGKAAKARIEAALKALPDVKIDADSSRVDKKIAAIRAGLKELDNKRIGVDISDDEAQARLAALRTQLGGLVRDVQKLKEEGKDVPINLDAFKAIAEVTGLKKEITDLQREASKPVKVPVKVDDAEIGRFEETLDRRLGAAIKALPKIDLNANSTDADRAIAEIRAELESLSGKRVGVDISDEEALAKVTELTARLDELGAKSPNVQVRTDTAAASAELSKVTLEAERVAALHPTVQVDADTAGATAQLAAVDAASGSSIGSLNGLVAAGIALGPALIPAAAGAAAAIGALGAVAFTAAAAIGVVALAIVPVIAAVKALGAADDASGQAASSGASRQLQMAGAIDQVRSARASLANVTANAADSERRAAEQVTNAELTLAQAQQASLRAQQAINDAREQARRTLEDLNNQVADGALAQRKANLDLQDAKLALDNVNSNPNATARQREDAQLAYDQAKQQIVDLGTRQRQTVEDQQKAQAKGIDGSTQVVAARQAEVQAAEQVRKAEQGVLDARAAEAAQARQNAFAVAQAAQGVVSAQRAVQAASISAGAAGGAAANNLATAFAALSPAGAAFARFLYSLKPIFVDLSKAAQDGFLPPLQAGISALLPIMPKVTEFVRRFATVLGDLAFQALTALASPFWQNFFTQMSNIALPLLQQLGPLFLSVAKGVAGLLLAFAPFAPQIIGYLSQLATHFADWASTLGSNSGFHAFVDYVNANGPLLVSLLGSLALITLKLLIALAPLGELLIRGATALATFLATLSPGQLVAIAAAIGAIALAFFALVGGPITLVVAGVTAIAAALVYAYTHVTAFRDIVNTAWNSVIKPIFEAWLTYAKFMIDAAVSWWQHAVATYQGISSAISTAWAVIKPIFDAIGYVVREILIPIFLLFWHNVIQPAWQNISLVISVAWAAIQVIFGLIQIGLKILGFAFTALYDTFIRPVWEGQIRPVLSLLGSFVTQQVVPAFQVGINALGQIFSGLRDKFKEPIRFVVNTVLNDGLLGAYNWIASRFGVKPDNVRVALPAGFADGGLIAGPGGPRDDAILARLSAGEYIIPAHVVSAWGIGFFDRLIGKGGVSGVARPGDGSQGIALPAFADGGLVGALKSTWNALANPIGWVKDHVKGLFDKVPGAGILNGVVTGVGHKLIDGALGFVERFITNTMSTDGVYTGPISADVVSVQNWIKAQSGKPYIWAGAGPAGYDCCIVGGVRVYGPDGAKAIKDVRAGDRVYSYVEGKLEAHTVTAAWQSKFQAVFAVRTRNRTVTASANHPFLRVVQVGHEQVEHWEDALWPGLLETYRNAAECSLSTCSGKVLANGMCGTHRARWDKHGDPRIKMVMRGRNVAPLRTFEEADWPGVPENSRRSRRGAECTLSTCAYPAKAKGMCGKHLGRFNVHGDPRIRLSRRAKFETEWARLDELTRGDLLVQPRFMPTETEAESMLPDGTNVDADVAWFVGAMVGDGCVNDRSVRLCMYGEDRDRATQIIKSRWGGNPCYGPGYGLVISNMRLAKCLSDLGMRRLGPEKRVPDAVWSWPTESQRAFLNGYCDADGHRPANQSKHGERTYHSASRELIEDVRALHVMLGDPVSNIHVTKRTKPIIIKGKLVKNALDQHAVAVWAVSNKGNEARLRNNPALAEWLDAGDFTLNPVLSIDAKGEQDTWDLEVEGAHNFVADGVVVHNSGFVGSAYRLIHGQNPYSRIFSTSNEAGFFPKPGHGLFTAGWANPGERGGGSVGHTAGNLAGLAFESGGRLGNVHYGPGSTSVDSFAHVGHYDSGGPLPPGLTIARNDTGKTEWVFTDEQTRALGGRGGGTTVNVHGSDGMSVHELTQAVMAEMAWQTR